MYCYSNDGLASRTVDSSYVAQTGEVLFTTPATPTQLTAAFPNYAAYSQAQQNVQTALVMLNSTVTVTSASSTAVNGVYAVNAQAIADLSAVEIYILKNGVFPTQASTINWPDASGTMHTFPNVSVFSDFATKVADYVYSIRTYINNKGTGTLPSNILSIL